MDTLILCKEVTRRKNSACRGAVPFPEGILARAAAGLRAHSAHVLFINGSFKNVNITKGHVRGQHSAAEEQLAVDRSRFATTLNL